MNLPGDRVIVKALDCGIVVCEFELQLRYYVHFRTNTFGKRYEPSYPPSYGLNSTTAVLKKKKKEDGLALNNSKQIYIYIYIVS